MLNVYHLLLLLYWVSLTGTCVIAWSLGSRPEQLGASALAIASLSAAILTQLSKHDYAFAQVDILLIDLALLGVLLFILFTTDRFWPIWASGFHLVGVATHLAKLSYPDILPQAYWAVQGAWAYPIMAAIALGAKQSTRRRRIGQASLR